MALGLQAYHPMGKRGKPLKRTAYALTPGQGNRFRAIYAARLRANGINPKRLSAAEFARSAQRGLTGRLQAIGFLASGWLPAIKAFMRATGMKGRNEGMPSDGRQRGRAKGSGTPAKGGDFKPEAILENSVGREIGGGFFAPGRISFSRSQAIQRIRKYLTDGLSIAFMEETANLREHNRAWWAGFRAP
jgi:hypothetical protein